MGFQVKSFEDLGKRTYLRDLKAQVIDAKNEFGPQLDQYYIILCTPKLFHDEKIRQIKNAFGKADLVTVIDPTLALTFLRLNSIKISSVVSSILRSEDIVYEQANRILSEFTPLEVAIILEAIYDSIIRKDSKIKLEDFAFRPNIQRILAAVPDYPRDYYYEEDIENPPRTKSRKKPKEMERGADERIAEAIDILEGKLFTYDGDSNEAIIDLEFSLPIEAVILDSMVRYGYKGEQILKYLIDFMGIYETANEETDDWVENI